MDQTIIEEKLKEQILAISTKKIDKRDINSDTNLVENLALDSVLIVQLILELENIFNILFEDEDLEDNIITNYGKLLGLIIQKVERNQECEIKK